MYCDIGPGEKSLIFVDSVFENRYKKVKQDKFGKSYCLLSDLSPPATISLRWFWTIVKKTAKFLFFLPSNLTRSKKIFTPFWVV